MFNQKVSFLGLSLHWSRNSGKVIDIRVFFSKYKNVKSDSLFELMERRWGTSIWVKDENKLSTRAEAKPAVVATRYIMVVTGAVSACLFIIK
jgi:hypothetical protein